MSGISKRILGNQKTALAARILDNPVYLPESGMRKSLTEALAKLPLKQLQNLLVIIDLKVAAGTKDAS